MKSRSPKHWKDDVSSEVPILFVVSDTAFGSDKVEVRVQTLRPLKLGEILDRAVTLTVRYFVPLASIYVVFAIPLAVVQYFASRDFARFMTEVTSAIGVQASGGKPVDPNVLMRHLAGASGPSGWTTAMFALLFFVGPLATAALTYAIAAYYEGRPVTFGSAYRVGLARWLPLIGINLLYVAAALALYVAVVMIGVILAFGLVFITQFAHAVGIALAVLAGAAALLAVALAGALGLVALQTSYFTSVVEGAGVVRSFARGVTRVFGRLGFGRALLVAAAYLAVGLGLVVVNLAGDALLAGLLRSAIAAEAFSAVLRIVSVAFLGAFVGVLYFDMRVREEGYDLELAAQAVQSQTLPA